MRIARRHPRPGFTLVELLVAMALCILIMTILSYAFQQAMDTFSHLKSIGDLQERLRSAEVILRSDLADHALDSESGPRVSDQRMDLLSSNPNAWKPPRGGFFRVVQETALNTNTSAAIPPQVPPYPAYQLEDVDPDGLMSTRARDHILHFTMKRSADRPDRVFRTEVPTAAYPSLNAFGLLNQRTNTNEFVSQWAEVAYFLDLTKPSATTPGSSLPMYPLVRRVRLLTSVANSQYDWGPHLPNHQGMSFRPHPDTTFTVADNRLLNGPDDVANPHRRLGGIASARTENAFVAPALPVSTRNQYCTLSSEHQAGVPTGSDILLTNVISFEVRLAWDPGPGATSGTVAAAPRNFSAPTRVIPPGPYPATAHTDAPFDDPPLASLNNDNGGLANKRVFDTWWGADNGNSNWNSTGVNAGKVPAFLRVKAIQIKVRIYDPKNKFARQITLIQDV